MSAQPRKTSNRYKNLDFLKTLGAHCRKLRMQRGYSIDRLAKESEQLSSSVIHRLETGSVTISALLRYANVLGVPLKQLLDFEHPDSSNVGGRGAAGRAV